MLDEVLNLTEKISIINHSDLVDVTILECNYSNLIKDTINPEEIQQFVILRSNTQLRIKELTNA